MATRPNVENRQKPDTESFEELSRVPDITHSNGITDGNGITNGNGISDGNELLDGARFEAGRSQPPLLLLLCGLAEV